MRRSPVVRARNQIDLRLSYRIGPQLLGTFFNFSLYGVLAVQVYIYHLAFPNDNVKIKGLVYFVLAFETAQTIMNGADAFNSFARGFGNLLVAGDPGISPVYTPIMGSIIAFVVQMFFCYRIYIIRNTAWWLSAGIAVISLMQAVCGFVGGVRSMLLLWLVGDAVADVAIALSMSFFLLTSRQSRQTYDVVAKIVTLTIETNVATSVVAIISLILYAALPTQTYFVCPTLFLGKIYSNTLLMTFNNRATVASKMKSDSNNQASTMGNYPTWRSQTGTVPFHAGLNPDLADTDTFTSNTIEAVSEYHMKHKGSHNPTHSYSTSHVGTEEYGMHSGKVRDATDFSHAS
ncbi:hypothetical protein CPB85DRAFT_1317296 [Mucidula mucida]|nr:hypothetical protein CPB85DRAFT_1317296 [Mucidula mucida]